ncbi:hypothetical protein QBC38DRAFT_488736 [Podospora fimiseda]|uniref:Uncharacterized protein n=1 Tax=Podospora fimiseda TaxID=252190 RepID=A0AAN6YQ80_9PEZI|nr:hypothetical protein QBC38DRAFT_488736 [Podospora fimiseda]
MEFRPILRRLAGNGARIRQFTTDTKLEAAAAAEAVRTTSSPSPPSKPAFRPPSATQIRADALRLKMQKDILPPRPAPFARSSFLNTPRGQPNPSSVPSQNPILSALRADMEKSTSKAQQTSHAQWKTTDFLKKYNMTTVEMRLRPQTGRTIPVQGMVDVARAFKILEGHCSRNKVRADSRMQKYHERPGLKRKRLKSERWQARFRQGFSATISRVMELRGQGW